MKKMKEMEDIFIKNLPTIDLHGYDRDGAKVAVKDFVDEAILMGWNEVVIVHGIGSGIVKMAVQEALYRNKKVLDYHIYGGNVGCTIAKIEKK